MLTDLPWGLIAALGSTGIVMALLSSLVGMRQKVEVPLWWALYAVWIAVVLLTGVQAPFRTILLASIFAGIVHGTTQGFLIERYKRSNPWYADKMKGPNAKLAMMFVVMGVVIGVVFGAVVGGIAWGLARL